MVCAFILMNMKLCFYSVEKPHVCFYSEKHSIFPREKVETTHATETNLFEMVPGQNNFQSLPEMKPSWELYSLLFSGECFKHVKFTAVRAGNKKFLHLVQTLGWSHFPTVGFEMRFMDCIIDFSSLWKRL